LNEGHDYGFARSIVLVFYAGNILVDKNTLYNGLSVLFRVFKLYG